MTAQDHQETPTTAAGKRAFESMTTGSGSSHYDYPEDYALELILAIEAEAAARQVERIAALEGALRNEHVILRGPAHAAGAALFCPDCALLSAGDKAGAPPPDKNKQPGTGWW